MILDDAQDFRALALIQFAEALDGAAARRVPVDAVARLAELRIGQQVGRTVTQTTAYDGQQLAGDRMQRFAPYTQGAHAQSRRHQQSGAFAHGCLGPDL